MAREVEVAGNAVVIRFRPVTQGPVLKRAMLEFRRADHYGLSVFADTPRIGEAEGDVIERLFLASELSGMDPESNPKAYVCGEARNLSAAGFVFLKDETENELPEHFCVSLGEAAPSHDTVSLFLAAFDRTEKRKQ